ncbi:Uu.00g028370.m01.CDS01 [Anthostomella pinea]|uniref:Uu.00g028370.m01.CDS01 n=1 Tax=Anthostomella pinea TaxID=933095 RepID=A0AAI8V7W0_9PEZI|nr:Uu.00g028370.m01.CDS01 [Anthostomella pinea]
MVAVEIVIPKPRPTKTRIRIPKAFASRSNGSESIDMSPQPKTINHVPTTNVSKFLSFFPFTVPARILQEAARAVLAAVSL